MTMGSPAPAVDHRAELLQLRKDIADMQTKHKQDLDMLTMTNRQELQTQREEHDKVIRSFLEKHRNEMQQLRDHHKADGNTLTDEMQQLKDKHNQAIADLKKQHNDKLAQIAERHRAVNDRQKALRERDHQQAIATLQSEIAAAQQRAQVIQDSTSAKIAKQGAELKTIREELAVATKTLAENEARHRADMERTIKHYSSKLDEANNSATEAAVAHQARATADKAALKTAKQSIANLQTEKESLLQQIENERAERKNDVDKLTAAFATSRGEIEKLEKELDKNEELLRQMDEKHKQQLQQLQENRLDDVADRDQRIYQLTQEKADLEQRHQELTEQLMQAENQQRQLADQYNTQWGQLVAQKEAEQQAFAANLKQQFEEGKSHIQDQYNSMATEVDSLKTQLQTEREQHVTNMQIEVAKHQKSEQDRRRLEKQVQGLRDQQKDNLEYAADASRMATQEHAARQEAERRLTEATNTSAKHALALKKLQERVQALQPGQLSKADLEYIADELQDARLGLAGDSQQRVPRSRRFRFTADPRGAPVGPGQPLPPPGELSTVNQDAPELAQEAHALRASVTTVTPIKEKRAQSAAATMATRAGGLPQVAAPHQPTPPPRPKTSVMGALPELPTPDGSKWLKPVPATPESPAESALDTTQWFDAETLEEQAAAKLARARALTRLGGKGNGPK